MMVDFGGGGVGGGNFVLISQVQVQKTLQNNISKDM